MEFMEAKGQTFLTQAQGYVRVNYLTRPDPEAFGYELAMIVKDALEHGRPIFDVYFTGDRKFIFHTSADSTVNFCELRLDKMGMRIPSRIPRVREECVLPLISGRQFGPDTGFHFHEYDFSIGEVSKVIMASVQQAINDDQAANSDSKP